MRQDLHQENAFLALADALSLLVVLVRDGRIVRVNPAGSALLGGTGESLVGRRFSELAPGIEASRRSTHRLRHADGREVWVDFTTDSIHIDGRPATLVTGHDVTEAKRAEETLRKSEQLLRGLYARTPTYMWAVDYDGRYMEVSDALLEKLGYERDELIGTDSRKQLTPESLRRLLEMNARNLEAKDWWTRDFPIQVVHKNGEVFDIRFSGVPELDASGQPQGWLCVATDFTDVNRAQEALKQSEERFRSAFENAAVGKAIVGPDLRFQKVNRAYCGMFGYSEAELTERTPIDLTHEDDPGESVKLMERLLSGEISSGRALKRYRHKDGRTVWGEQTVTLMRDAAGRPAFYIGEIIDVTERILAEELVRDREAKLAEAQRVAHIGSWEYDIPNDRSAWSEELYRIFGTDPRTFTPSMKSAFARFHKDDVLRVERHVQRAIEAGLPFEFEARFLLDGGEIRVLHSIGRAEKDASGHAVRLYGVAQDVTDRKRAEELLRDREAKLAEAQRVAHLGSWEYDIASKRSIWSDEMYRIFRLDPLRFDPSRDSAIPRIHPDDAARSGAAVQETIANGSPYQYEFRIVLDDGEIRSLWTIGRAELGSDGRPSRIYGIVQDITERKRAEDRLRGSEERFRNIYTQAPVLMTVVGPDLCFREVSTFWLERFGYQRHEVVGRPALDFVDPEFRERMIEELQRSLAGGEHVIRSRPVKGVRKDGTIVDALVTTLLEIDAQGNFQGAVTVGLDVSHMRRAEEAVRESEARYRAMVEYAPEAIVVADGDDGKFVDVNEQAVRLFRRTRAELLSLGPAECSPAFQPNGRASPEMAQDMIQRAAVDTQTFEWTHLDGEGRDIPCLIRLSKMPDRTRNLIRATITDISQQKAMEAKLRQDDRMAAIGLLAAGVAHEIGNPLLALSMAAQSLERKAQDEYSAKKLTLIREHIERISKIVRQMSDLARAPVQTRSAIDLQRVLDRTLEVIRYDKRAKEVEIEVDPCHDLPFVQAAEDQLVQVCLNLALNALDAMAANPPDRPRSLKIGLRCLERDGGRFVRAGFRDSGPGIPEASRGRVFQPFFTTKEAGKGTGLGLSVSFRIIEEHQGKLGFETDLEKGTEFYFELPVREAR